MDYIFCLFVYRITELLSLAWCQSSQMRGLSEAFFQCPPPPVSVMEETVIAGG